MFKSNHANSYLNTNHRTSCCFKDILKVSASYDSQTHFISTNFKAYSTYGYIPCPFISCHVISNRMISFDVESDQHQVHVLSCHVCIAHLMSYLGMSFHIFRNHIISFCFSSCSFHIFLYQTKTNHTLTNCIASSSPVLS